MKNNLLCQMVNLFSNNFLLMDNAFSALKRKKKETLFVIVVNLILKKLNKKIDQTKVMFQ